MSRVAAHLADFRSTTDGFEVMYYPEFSDLPAIKGEDIHAGIICSLHHWRSNKPRHFIENLLTNGRFRTLIENVTGSSGEDWYRFVTRLPGQDDVADRALMDKFNGAALVAGSHLERTQAYFECGTEMPGICYPRSPAARRQATRDDETQTCWACRVEEALFQAVGLDTISKTGELAEPTIQQCALLSIDIPIGTYPYVKHPKNLHHYGTSPSQPRR